MRVGRVPSPTSAFSEETCKTSGRLVRAFGWETGRGRPGPKGPLEVGDGPCAGPPDKPHSRARVPHGGNENMSETTLDRLRHPASMRVLTEPPRGPSMSSRGNRWNGSDPQVCGPTAKVDSSAHDYWKAWSSRK